MSDDASTSDRGAGPVLAHVPRPRLNDPVTVDVVADPHLAASGEGGWKLRHRSERRLRTAVNVADDADVVIFAGDLTNDGRPAEFDLFDRIVADLGSPWTAIPGNHDVPKSFDDHESPALAAFVQRYLGDATPAVGSHVSGGVLATGAYPTVLRIGGLRILCLNTAAPGDASTSETWGGAIGRRQRERLASALAADPSASTLVVGHHNLGSLPEHTDGQPWHHFPAADATAVREVLTKANVGLAVTAHHHVPGVRKQGGLTELLSPAVCSFPQAMLSLRVGPRGTTARLVPLAGPEGIEESYWHAATGKPLGQGVLELATTRVNQL